jgi:signal transduction histidine kinase
MSRWLPHSIAGRTVLVLVLGLAATQFLAAFLRYSDRDRALAALEDVRIAEQVAMVTGLIEETAPPERRRLAERLARPVLQVRWGDRPVLPAGAAGDETELMRRVIEARLSRPVEPRGVRVGYSDGNPVRLADEESRLGELPATEFDRVIERLASGRDYLISVQLDDRSWLNFHAPLVESLGWWSSRSIASTLLTIAGVIFLSLWAVRRFAAPLEGFGRAAERLGADIGAPALPERGPDEVRQTARAFNRMQARLKRFVEDRVQMAGAISHDLRTPVTRLRLRAELLDDADQRARMLADLREIEAIIASTLAFSREDGALGHEPAARTDLVALVESVCHDMADAGLPVAFGGGGRLVGDCRPLALRRALANLVDNAVKYGTRARVRVRADEDAAIGPAAVVEIDDDGPGIPEPELERVFRPYVRLEPSRSRDTGGIGLGLTLARATLRAHGGEVALANRPEGGLRATVTLPLADG